jgi:enterochelin esterase family protein
VLCDGAQYVHRIGAPAILDNLAAAGRLPPLVAVFVDAIDGAHRGRELSGDAPFAAFLAAELVPWARAQARVTRDPARTIVGGMSLGGLAAAAAAFYRPDVFGNVLSQSGSVYWKPADDPEYEWLARRFAAHPRQDVRFWLDVGRLETSPRPAGCPALLVANRHLRTVLRATGHTVHYHEFSGGHDNACWQITLPEALVALMGTT